MKYILFIVVILLCISCTPAAPITQEKTLQTYQGDQANTIPKIPMDTEIESSQEQENCFVFDDFTDTPEFRWGIVNDGVMGGKSQGNIDMRDNTLIFSGNIVTRGGGFSSLRGGLEFGVLSDYISIKLRAKSDGRIYRLTFRDSNNSRISHQAILPFQTPGEFEEISISFDQLETTFFGRNIVSEPFQKDSAQQIGVILSDGVDGEFRLVIDEVRFCR